MQPLSSICKHPPCRSAIQGKTVDTDDYRRSGVEMSYNEFSARQNVQAMDTMVQTDSTICGLFGKRLKHTDLVFGRDGRLH